MSRRLKRTVGQKALVDGIPFDLPVNSTESPALIAAFPVSAKAVAPLLPGSEVHPVRIARDTALLMITVLEYRVTDIGRYIEFSIAIACTHGAKPAPRLLPAIFQKHYGTGQYVVDLPVSTELSVRGGKGIWGMPKHQANLDFVITDDKVWSQYDLDGQLCLRIEVKNPKVKVPFGMSSANYCAFRGMLFKSRIAFKGHGGISVPGTKAATMTIGDHPRMAWLRDLTVGKRPLIAGYFSETAGVLDDHTESWFLFTPDAPTVRPEGLESVANLGSSTEWLAPPNDPEAEAAA